jgi:hypothetical protein
LKTLFLVSAAVILYAYVVYPAIIVAWAKLRARRVEKRYRHVPVSVVIAAKNEEANISARLFSRRSTPGICWRSSSSPTDRPTGPPSSRSSTPVGG